MKKLYFILGLCLCICACSSVPKTPQGFKSSIIETEHFSFQIFEKENIKRNKPIRFYIEGDGNPHPKSAVALKLAEKDPADNVIYLSRPCQYIDSAACQNSAVYKEARFHEEIFNEMEELTAFLMKKYKTPSIELVGYDGGGTMALLLATKLPRVTRVITVAGILDVDAYTKHNNLPALTESLNPADKRNIIAQIPQIHYVGGQDEITTRRMAERFVARLQNPKSAVVKVVPAMNHSDWEKVTFDYY